MENKKNLFIIFILVFSIACSSAKTRRSGKELSQAESLKAEEYLAYINDFNNSSPDNISSSFSAYGNTGEKKFRVEGKIDYSKKGYYKFSIVDYIFKSPVIEAYRDLETLYFYYPVEKKLLIDNINKINLSMYTGFESDYKFIFTLLTGGIPELEDYSVYNCLYDEKAKGYYLILENEEYFENIFFKGNVPDKILIIHKESRNKAEIYFKSMIKKDKSIFFKSYKIVLPEMNVSVNISFSKPVLNGKVNVEKLDQKKLPKKVDVIKVN